MSTFNEDQKDQPAIPTTPVTVSKSNPNLIQLLKVSRLGTGATLIVSQNLQSSKTTEIAAAQEDIDISDSDSEVNDASEGDAKTKCELTMSDRLESTCGAVGGCLDKLTKHTETKTLNHGGARPKTYLVENSANVPKEHCHDKGELHLSTEQDEKKKEMIKTQRSASSGYNSMSDIPPESPMSQPTTPGNGLLDTLGHCLPNKPLQGFKPCESQTQAIGQLTKETQVTERKGSASSDKTLVENGPLAFSASQPFAPAEGLQGVPKTLKYCVQNESLPSSSDFKGATREQIPLLVGSLESLSLELPSHSDQQNFVPLAQGFPSTAEMTVCPVRSLDHPSSLSFYKDIQSGYCQEMNDPNKDMTCKILRSTYCSLAKCDDDKCLAGRRIIADMTHFLEKYYTVLATDIMQEHYLYGTAVSAINAIQKHSTDCFEVNCKVPLCSFFTNNNIGSLAARILLKRIADEYFSGQHHLVANVIKQQLENDSNNLSCCILAHRKSKFPVENDDFNNITRIGNFGNAVIAHTCEDLQYWFVKKALCDRAGSLRDVFLLLHSHQHKSILPHQWLLTTEKYICYATTLCAVPLYGKLRNAGSFLDEACWRLMQQMVDAATFLHNLGILFLNWRCKCIMFYEEKGIAKLTNFSNSVMFSAIDDDTIFSLRMSILPNLVPPEIYDESWGEVDEKSDVWGLGALLYEMTTGTLIHERYCHEEPDSVRDMLKENPVVALDAVKDMEIKKLLRKCFKVKCETRCSVEDIKGHVQLKVTAFDNDCDN